MEENEYVKKIHELEQELKIRIDDNAELYAKLCNALVQLNEANKVIKKYAYKKTKVKITNYDLYYKDTFVNVPMALNDKPAKKYLEKWGVK